GGARQEGARGGVQPSDRDLRLDEVAPQGAASVRRRGRGRRDCHRLGRDGRARRRLARAGRRGRCGPTPTSARPGRVAASRSPARPRRGRTMTTLVAVDVGAQSGRVAVGRLDDGVLTVEEVHRFPNEPVLVQGTLYWDALRL